MFGLASDQVRRAIGKVHRRDDELVPGVPLGVARQEVEEGAGVLAESRLAGEKAEVGVEPSGGGVVIAGSQVDVAADSVVLSADDERGLTVRLETDDAVHDVDAGFLEHPGLVDVVLFVQPSLELDQSGDLLAVLGRAGKGA